jgi:hypothetical protein
MYDGFFCNSSELITTIDEYKGKGLLLKTLIFSCVNEALLELKIMEMIFLWIKKT